MTDDFGASVNPGTPSQRNVLHNSGRDQLIRSGLIRSQRRIRLNGQDCLYGDCILGKQSCGQSQQPNYSRILHATSPEQSSPQVTHTPNEPSAMRRRAASTRRKRVLRWQLLSNRDSFDKLMTHRSALSFAESTSSDRDSCSSRFMKRRTSARLSSSFCLSCSISICFMVRFPHVMPPRSCGRMLEPCY